MLFQNFDLTIFDEVTGQLLADIDSVPTTSSTFMIGLT